MTRFISPNDAARSAATKLLSMKLPSIKHRPDMADAEGIVEYLDAICTIIDPLIECVGEHVHYHFGLGTEKERADLFRNQLRNALEGNAMYAVKSAAERQLECDAGERSDAAYDRERDDRMWDAAE